MTEGSQGREESPQPRSRARAIAGAAAFGLVVAFVLIPLQTREPLADGVFYVATLHSLYADGSVDLTNEGAQFPWLGVYSGAAVPLPGGPRNPFPIGPAVMWSPFYAVYDLGSRALGGAGATTETGIRTAPIYYATSFWVAIGLCMLSATSMRLGASRFEAILVSAAIFGLSPLPGYVTYAADWAHGCGFAAVCILLYACVALRQDSTPESPKWLLCGLSLGLVFLVRWQDAMFGILPLALLWFWREPSGRPKPLAHRFRGALYVTAGAALGTLPQLAYWKALYGTWFLLPGFPEHTGRAAAIFTLSDAEPLAFFFSTWNGAFLCHPALALCIAGFLLHRSGPFSSLPGLRAAAAIGVALQVATSITYPDWWGGGSFGQRRFVSTLPFLALGLFAVWHHAPSWHPHARRALATLLLLLGAWNGLSLYRLHEGSIPYNPAHRVWYREGVQYERYDYGRRLRDILLGAPDPPPRGAFLLQGGCLSRQCGRVRAPGRSAM